MTEHIPYILLADDDKDDCFLFNEALQEINANVHLLTAEHGKALMELLENATLLPDMIFLDINMPYKSGKECLVEIRNSEAFSSIPVIIYSTSVNPRDVEETYEAGANLYLQKPHHFSGLTEMLTRLLALDWTQYESHADKEKFVLTIAE